LYSELVTILYLQKLLKKTDGKIQGKIFKSIAKINNSADAHFTGEISVNQLKFLSNICKPINPMWDPPLTKVWKPINTEKIIKIYSANTNYNTFYFLEVKHYRKGIFGLKQISLFLFRGRKQM